MATRKNGAKLYSRYGWLFGTAMDHEGPPTQGMREVDAELSAELARQRAALGELVENRLTEFNRLAAEHGVSHIAPTTN